MNHVAAAARSLRRRRLVVVTDEIAETLAVRDRLDADLAAAVRPVLMAGRVAPMLTVAIGPGGQIHIPDSTGGGS